MKRAIGVGLVALLLATAAGCKKDKKKAEEAPAGDKTTEPATTDPAAGGTAPAGGDMAGGDKAGGDMAGGDKAGGDKAGGDMAGGDMAPAGGVATATDVCKKLEELATAEGGAGLEKFNKNLKSDCEKEMGEEKAKNEAGFQEFSKCLADKKSFTEASKGCTQIN